MHHKTALSELSHNLSRMSPIGNPLNLPISRGRTQEGSLMERKNLKLSAENFCMRKTLSQIKKDTDKEMERMFKILKVTEQKLKGKKLKLQNAEKAIEEKNMALAKTAMLNTQLSSQIKDLDIRLKKCEGKNMLKFFIYHTPLFLI